MMVSSASGVLRSRPGKVEEFIHSISVLKQRQTKPKPKIMSFGIKLWNSPTTSSRMSLHSRSPPDSWTMVTAILLCRPWCREETRRKILRTNYIPQLQSNTFSKLSLKWGFQRFWLRYFHRTDPQSEPGGLGVNVLLSLFPSLSLIFLYFFTFHPNWSQQMTLPSRGGVCSRFLPTWFTLWLYKGNKRPRVVEACGGHLYPKLKGPQAILFGHWMPWFCTAGKPKQPGSLQVHLSSPATSFLSTQFFTRW